MSYSSEVLADSPWGFWRLQETSGFNLADSSGSARDLGISGSPTLNQPGPGAEAATAWPNSTGSPFQYAVSSAGLATSTVTHEAWVYLDAYPTTRTGIVALADSFGGATTDKILSIEPDGRVSWFVYTGGSSWVYSSGALTLGAWHHIVASVGPAGQKIRVDKATVGSGTSTISYNSAMLVFLHGGGSGWTSASPVVISSPAIYLTQLSDARVDAHYDAMFPPAPTGTISATLPALSANLSGGVEFSGTLSATLPALGADLAGTSLPPGIAGTLSATLPALGGALAGAYSDTATLAAILPPLSADLAGTYAPPPVTGALSATLPSLAANLAGQAFEPGTAGFLAAALPALTASLSGDVLGRTGLGIALDSSAVLTVDAPLEPEPTLPPGTPSTALHIIAPTVPVPTLVAGRPQ